MGWVKDLSVGKKVLLIGLLPSVIGLSIAVTALFVNEKISTPARIAEGVDQLAEIIGGSSVAAITFADDDTAQSLLDNIKANPHILSAALYDAEGELFVQYANERADSLRKSRGSTSLFGSLAPRATQQLPCEPPAPHCAARPQSTQRKGRQGAARPGVLRLGESRILIFS